MAVVANGKGIVAPISLVDIRDVLQESILDVGSLCVSEKICKFAKHKPVRDPSLDTLERTYKSANDNCGLVPPEFYTSKASAIEGLKNGNVIWGYERPRGGAKEPYRMTDFDGYLHNSPSPFGDLTDSTVSNENGVIIAAIPPNINNTDFLTLGDFSNPNYNDWYLGIYLESTRNSYFVTAQETLGSGNGWQVDFGKIAAGTYTAIPFISSKQWILGGASPSDVLIAGIENTGVTVIVKSVDDIYKIIVRCYFSSYNILQYEVGISNTSNNSRIFNNVSLRIASTQQGNASQTVKSFGSITVNANSSWGDKGSVTVSGASNPSEYYKWCSLYHSGRSDEWVTMIATPVTPTT